MLPQPPLLVVTDRRQAPRALADILGAAFRGGCRWASIREKDLPPAEQVALARSLLPLARDFGARLMLHGDAALARDSGLDGVHLPAGSDALGARVLLGADALIGLSIHDSVEAEALDSAAVDYAVAGPAALTESKPGYGPALGTAGLAALAAACRVPLLTIGGITAGNARMFMDCGIAGIAVMGGLMLADDPAAEVRAILAATMNSR